MNLRKPAKRSHLPETNDSERLDQSSNTKLKETADLNITSPVSSLFEADKIYSPIRVAGSRNIAELAAQRENLFNHIHHNYFGKLCEDFFDNLVEAIEFFGVPTREVFEILLIPCLDDCFKMHVDAGCYSQRTNVLYDSICEIIEIMINLASLRDSIYHQQLDRYGSDYLLDAIKRKAQRKQDPLEAVNSLTYLIKHAEDSHYIASAIISTRIDDDHFFSDTTGLNFRVIRMRLLKNLAESNPQDQSLCKKIVDEVNASLMYEKDKVVWSIARSEFKATPLLRSLHTLAARNRYYCAWNKLASR